MLMGHINVKVYFLISIGVGITIYIVGLIGGPQLVQFFTNIQANALCQGVDPAIATIVIGPFIFVFGNPIAGAIIVGLLWPAIIMWLILLFLLMIIAAFTGGYNSASTATDLFTC